MVGWACSPGYVARAAWEEAKFLWRREPIERLLGDPGIAAPRRQKLELVLEVRRFAAEGLGLSVGGAYGTVSRVDGSALVHVVTVARRDRLERYTWWYPIIGRVPYRGFFSKASAEALEQALEEEGFDTYRRTATAFSTLGWFDDPLPSTLLDRDELVLTNTIVHELLHNTLFVKGQVDFNESAATFVGHRAAIEFYCGPAGLGALCERAARQWKDAQVIAAFLTGALSELEAFYEAKPGPEALDAGRSRIFGSIRERFRALELHRRRDLDDTRPLNNATLLHDRIYYRGLDRFEVLYRQAGSLRGAIRALAEIASAGNSPWDALGEHVGKTGSLLFETGRLRLGVPRDPAG